MREWEIAMSLLLFSWCGRGRAADRSGRADRCRATNLLDAGAQGEGVEFGTPELEIGICTSTSLSNNSAARTFDSVTAAFAAAFCLLGAEGVGGSRIKSGMTAGSSPG